jgi:hypothetical protein
MSSTVEAVAPEKTRPHAREYVRAMPALVAAIYPVFILSYRAAVAGEPVPLAVPAAVLFLALAFMVPAVGIAFAYTSAHLVRPTAFQLRARRLAYLTVAVPPLYVFAGVLNSMMGQPVRLEWTWGALWLAAGVWTATAGHEDAMRGAAPRWLGRLRTAHAITGGLILLFLTFHLSNHLFSLAGEQTHAAIMEAGRTVYRHGAVEPMLAAVFLAQAAGGLTLAWRWSALPADKFRTLQIASGVYLAAFIVGHMNTILIYARFFLKLPTGWAFMTGTPPGLLFGPIHLVPHYGLAVFFVLAHVASGARNIAIRRGAGRARADGIWSAGLAACALAAVAIMAGLTGVRVT